MENQNTRLVISFVVGLIVGVGGYWLINHSQTSDDMMMSDTNDTASTTLSTDVSSDTSTVVVKDQAAGNHVDISELNLTGPSWVAIHDDVDGQPGRILGAGLFDKGTASGTIDLLRNTVIGKSYIVVVHTDDGDYKHFVPATDKPLLDSAGKMVMTSFTAGE